MNRILLVRLSAMGDIIHTMPTAMAIKRQYPSCVLDWVVRDVYAGILEGHPAVDNVILHTRKPSLSRLLSLRSQLRRNHYDIALDMQGLLKSALVVGISGAKRKLGYHWQREGASLFSKAVKPKQSGLPVVEQYLAVAQELGCEPFPVRFGLQPTADALSSMQASIQDFELGPKTLSINLGAGREWKQWPRTSFARFIEGAELQGWSPFLVGGPADVHLAEELFQLLGRHLPSLVGKTTIQQLVAAIELSDAHVAGDTGSIHVATALDKPLICIMPDNGANVSPGRTGPYKKLDFTLSAPRIEEVPVEAALQLLSKLG